MVVGKLAAPESGADESPARSEGRALDSAKKPARNA